MKIYLRNQKSESYILTVDGIAMAISRMAPSHFLWSHISAGTLCPNYAVYG